MSSGVANPPGPRNSRKLVSLRDSAGLPTSSRGASDHTLTSMRSGAIGWKTRTVIDMMSLSTRLGKISILRAHLAIRCARSGP